MKSIKLVPAFLATLFAVAPLVAQSTTRTYVLDADGNRASSTRQVRFTAARGYAIDPRRALVGERINVYGRNLPAGNPGAVAVDFGGVPAPVIAVSERVLTVEIPVSAQSGSLNLSIQGGPPVSIGAVDIAGVVVTPGNPTLDYGQTQAFTAQVIGNGDQSVTWRVDGIAGGNAAVGTITPAGLYTAPGITSAQAFPFVIEARSAALGISGYALVELSCASSSTLPNRTLTSGTLANRYERDCFQFTGQALKRVYVALRSDRSIRSLTLRRSNGDVLATTGAGADLRIPSLILPEDDQYRLEVQGDAVGGGSYRIWVDMHDELPDGRWMSPFSGTWQTAGNWSNGRLPGATDDVVIPPQPTPVTVTLSGGVQDVGSVVSDASLVLTGGSLRVRSTVQVNELFRMQGGTLVEATVLAGAGGEPLVVGPSTGNRLDGVDLRTDMVLGETNSVVRIANGLRCSASVRMTGQSSSLAFEGDETIHSGSIVLANTAGTTYLEMFEPGTLTIAPGVSIQGAQATLGGSVFWGQRMDLVNQGSIVMADYGRTLTIDGRGGNFRNAPGGSVEVRNGAVLVVGASTWENQGAITSASTLRTAGVWTNSGTLTLAAGLAQLGGRFTPAGFGTFVNQGAKVFVTGTFDLDTGTFTLPAAFGSWHLDGGNIRNGTLVLPPAGLLIRPNNANRLVGAVIHGDLHFRENGASLRVAEDLEVHGNIRLSAQNSSLAFEGDQSVRNATIHFENSAGLSHLEAQTAGTITLEPSVTIRGGGGRIGGSYYYGQALGVRNSGRVLADVPSATLDIDGRGGTFINEPTGLMIVRPGSALTVNASVWNNQGTLVSDGTLDMRGGWSNGGTIRLLSGVAKLGGSFTLSGLGILENQGASVEITGAFELKGSTLVLDGGLGSWSLNGGSFRNGTVQLGNGAVLQARANTSNRLVAVTVMGDILLADSSSVVRIAGDLDIQGAVRLQGNRASLAFEGDQTIRRGTIVFEAVSGLCQMENVSDGRLTIAQGVLVHGALGTIGGSWQWGRRMDIDNHGTIRSDGGAGLTVDGRGGTFTNMSGGVVTVDAGSSLAMSATNWVNQGTLSSDGALDLNGAWRNLGTLALNAGSANFGGTFTPPDLGAFVNNGVEVLLDGTLDLAGGGFTLDATTGDWQLAGGVIRDGTLNQSGSVLRVGASTANRLLSVVVNGDLLLPFSSSVVRIGGDLRVNGSVRLQGNRASLAFEGDQTVRAPSAISFEVASGLNQMEMVSDGTLTLEPGVVVHGARGTIGGSWQWGRRMDLVNRGAIVADQSGGLTIDGRGGTFTNRPGAVARTANGGALTIGAAVSDNQGAIQSADAFSISGDWTNTGTISLTGGTATLGGAFSPADLGAFSNTGADVTLSATVDLAGGALTLDGTTGDWVMSGAVIQNGSLVQSGARLIPAANSGNRLLGVSITGDLLLDRSSAVVRIGGGLRVSGGSVRLSGARTSLGFEGSQNVETGTRISIETTTTPCVLEMVSAGSLTFLSGSSLVGSGPVTVGGSWYWGQAMNQVDNRGRIELTGSGTIQSLVVNSGVISPGGAGMAGVTRLTRGYTQTANGSLAIDLGGLTAQTTFDQLVVTGTVSLGGALGVATFGGFTPGSGNTFQVISSGQPSGTFSNTVPNFTISYPATGVVLTRQ